MILLDAVEARIAGSLIEKSLTVPEYYPLSLNALLLACNQKSSRDPVMNLDENALNKPLFNLLNKGVVERHHEPGSRVPKFKHHVELLISLGTPQEIAVICVLLLRGPQTPGEIKTRTDRLCSFASTAEVDGTLHDLSARADGPFVVRLPRQTGQKEARYMHLFCGPVAGGETVPTPEPVAMQRPAPQPATPSAAAQPDRLAQLEKRVEALEAALKKIEDRLGQPA